MAMGNHVRMYSVYSKKTDQPLIIYATSKDCAKAMGIKVNSFYRYICRMRGGKIELRKWVVYEDGKAIDNDECGATIKPKKERPPTDLTGKCGSCAYAKPADWENSKVYVCCTNYEQLFSYTRNRKRQCRPRTTKACKHYSQRGDE